MKTYTIYKHPRDYKRRFGKNPLPKSSRPNSYVMRVFEVDGNVAFPTDEIKTATSLQEIRALIHQIAPGCVCESRQPEDDSVIVETWI